MLYLVLFFRPDRTHIIFLRFSLFRLVIMFFVLLSLFRLVIMLFVLLLSVFGKQNEVEPFRLKQIHNNLLFKRLFLLLFFR